MAKYLGNCGLNLRPQSRTTMQQLKLANLEAALKPYVQGLGSYLSIQGGVTSKFSRLNASASSAEGVGKGSGFREWPQ